VFFTASLTEPAFQAEKQRTVFFTALLTKPAVQAEKHRTEFFTALSLHYLRQFLSRLRSGLDDAPVVADNEWKLVLRPSFPHEVLRPDETRFDLRARGRGN